MIDKRVSFLLIYAAGIVVKSRSGRHTARDRAPAVDLRLHLVPATDTTVLLGLCDSVLIDHETIVRPTTAAAVDFCAFAIARLIIIARLVHKALVMRVGVDTSSCAALTTAGICAIDHLLNGKIGGWPGALSINIDAVSKCTRRAHRPAASTVDGNVLIAGGTAVVYAVDIAPVVSDGQSIFEAFIFPNSLRYLVLHSVCWRLLQEARAVWITVLESMRWNRTMMMVAMGGRRETAR